MHVAPFITNAYFTPEQKHTRFLDKDKNQEGYKQFQELLKQLKSSCLKKDRKHQG